MRVQSLIGLYRSDIFIYGSSRLLATIKPILTLCNFQVEVTIAYGCTDKLSNDRILEYIHFNRLSNEMKITHLGKSCRQTPTS